MALRKVIKALSHSVGIDIVRYVPELNRPFAILPLLLRDHLAKGQPFYFVQIGANDGVLDDPLRALILEHQLTGLLVEPLPDIFEKLKRNYQDQPQLIFENVAVSQSAGTLPIYRVRSDAPVPHHWHGIAGFTKTTLLTQGVPEQFIETSLIEGVSFTSLLSKHRIQTVNLLQVDTEGYDFEVIKSAFDAGVFPDIINYEHCWLVPNIRYRCKQMLDRYGYQFVETGKDTVAVRRAK